MNKISSFLVFFTITFYIVFLIFGSKIFIFGFDIPRYLALGSDDWLTGGINSLNGRFFPFAAQQYNLFKLFTEDVLICYIYRASAFVISILVLRKILIEISGNLIVSNLVVLFVMLLPNSVNVWSSLTTTEGEIFLLLSIMFYIYNKYYFRLEEKRYIAFFIILIGTGILYYKELLFLMLGSFAMFHMLFRWIKDDKKNTILNITDIALLLGVIVFLLLYVFIVYIDFVSINAERYGGNDENTTLLLKNIFSYLLNDSIIILFSLPMLIYRLYLIIRKKSNISPFYDAMLISGNMYLFAYLILNMYNLNYLLPAYVMVLPPLIYFLVKLEYYKIKFIVFLSIANIFIVVLNNIPLSLHMLSSYWYSPKNFFNTTVFVSEYIKHNDKKVNLFFDGISINIVNKKYTQKFDRGLIMNFSQELLKNGIEISQFDIKSNILQDSKNYIEDRKDYPFSIFNSEKTYKIAQGDILIVSPQSRSFMNNKFLDSISQEYELLYKTESEFYLVNYSLKNIIKYMLILKSEYSNDLVKNSNVFSNPNYFIYKKL